MFLYLIACPQLVEINPQKDTGHENVPVEHTCPEDSDQPMYISSSQTNFAALIKALGRAYSTHQRLHPTVEIRGFVDGMSLKIHFLASQFT